uniref:Uncharacterized protein n=1 Tax=Rhizophagus irregularis (strain DAOM 181602 / DAOM 197198 / MUCL 43194) TaxID=747089 RepID=U9U3M1_RHIID
MKSLSFEGEFLFVSYQHNIEDDHYYLKIYALQKDNQFRSDMVEDSLCIYILAKFSKYAFLKQSVRNISISLSNLTWNVLDDGKHGKDDGTNIKVVDDNMK